MSVSRHTLEKVAGTIWLVVGLWLATFGCIMLSWAREQEAASYGALATSLVFGIWVGALKGRYALSVTAQKNLRRIARLKSPRVWQVFSPRTLALIGGMIGLGKGLRALAENGLIGGYTVVGGVYVGIGVALARSSMQYWKVPAPPRDRSDVRLANGPTGVLLVNLGTPDSPSVADVRRYLRQFLSDPLVIEFNRVAWWLILNLIIVPFRGPKSAALYRTVWTPEGSPILVWGRRLRDRVAEKLGADFEVVLGMRYGNPSLATALKELYRAGCREIMLLPLFPQASRTTTGSVLEEAYRLVSLKRNQPALNVLGAFPLDPGYVEAVAQRTRGAVGERGADHYVFSFHGIPEAYEESGDEYGDQCAVTARAVARKLGLADEDWTLVFQSRFGPDPWLRPYADETVPALAKRHARVAIVLPGFAADCLETLEEIGTELRADFEDAGGEELIVVPALNDHPRWVEALSDRIRRAAQDERSEAESARFSVL